MENNITGQLKTWNPDKGFGFIRPINGGQDIFIHISDYPKTGGAPKLGETLSFQIALNNEGKKKAICAQRPGIKSITANKSRSQTSAENQKSSFFDRLISWGIIVLIAVIGYKFLIPKITAQNQAPVVLENSPTVATRNPAPIPLSNTSAVTTPSSFKCDGRTQCAQMTSCSEAKYFIQHCPNTKMDGDGDGIPCESQWC